MFMISVELKFLQAMILMIIIMIFLWPYLTLEFSTIYFPILQVLYIKGIFYCFCNDIPFGVWYAFILENIIILVDFTFYANYEVIDIAYDQIQICTIFSRKLGIVFFHSLKFNNFWLSLLINSPMLLIFGSYICSLMSLTWILFSITCHFNNT